MIEHSNNTDSDALKVNAFIIFKNLALLAGYYLAFCFNTFKMANCKMSPISSKASEFIWCWRYSIALVGLLLFNKINAFLFVDRSV